MQEVQTLLHSEQPTTQVLHSNLHLPPSTPGPVMLLRPLPLDLRLRDLLHTSPTCTAHISGDPPHSMYQPSARCAVNTDITERGSALEGLLGCKGTSGQMIPV